MLSFPNFYGVLQQLTLRSVSSSFVILKSFKALFSSSWLKYFLSVFTMPAKVW